MNDGPLPCPPAIVSALPRKKYTADLGKTMLSQDCPICRDDFKVDDLVTFLTCKHAYHDGCLGPWLAQVLAD